MTDRLPSELWVSALIRRVTLGGASAFIVQAGDAERGDLLIKVARLDGTAAVFVPGTDAEGARQFRSLTAQGVGPNERDVDHYITRARLRDRDLWIIEIEDPAGRHFLTETIGA
jgi:hypothetical protein